MSEPRERVFVIDDDESVRRSLGRLLKSAGYDVDVLASADEFLQRLPYDGICCLVLDIQLPGINGLELQEVLAERDCVLPIVFITGHGDLPIGMRAMKAGALAFISKPFSDDTLLKAVDEALMNSRQQESRCR